ncbi:MAG: glycosyltransferase family 39 protein [candidate division Zixibacteria bacterium]|nr:glycosyltransferase family 39 protein [candidate division Zixibacteria bacterium]
MKKDKVEVLLVLAVSLGTSLLSFCFSKNYIDGDAITRTVMAIKWLEHPFYISAANKVSWVFGPLHCYLNALGLFIWNNPLYSPRLVSLIFSCAAVVPFYFLVKKFFPNKGALLASLSFSLISLRLQSSAIAVSEGINIFFVLSAIYYFFRYKEDRKLKYIFICAFFINLACMMRYDSWLLIPLLGILLLLKGDLKENFSGFGFTFQAMKIFLIFLILSSFFPISWMVGNYLKNDDALYFLHVAEVLNAKQFNLNVINRNYLGNLAYNLIFLPAVWFLSASPFIFILSIIGLIGCLFKNKGQGLYLILLAYILLFLYQFVFSGKMFPIARYTIIQGTLLLSFSSFGFALISQRLNKFNSRLLLGGFLLSILVSLFLITFLGKPETQGFRQKLYSISPLTQHPKYITEIIDFLKEKDDLLLDSRYFMDRLLVLYLYPKKDGVYSEWSSSAELISFIKRHKPSYIVYSDRNPYLRNEFRFVLGREKLVIDSSTYKTIFERKEYRIFELVRP